MTSFAANNARQSAYREEREYEPAPKRPAESYQTEQRSRSFGGNDYDENEEDFRPQYQSTREEPRQSAAAEKSSSPLSMTIKRMTILTLKCRLFRADRAEISDCRRFAAGNAV